MKVEITKRTNDTIVLTIYGEGHTLGNMIAKEALRHPAVKYASYRMPHPLQEKIELAIVTEGEDPLKALLEVIDRLRSTLKEFDEKIVKALGGGSHEEGK